MFNEVLEALKKLAEAFTTVQGNMRKHITLLANNALIHLFNIRKGPFYVVIPILIFHAKRVSAGSIDQQTGGFKRRQKLEDISMRGVGHFCFSLKIRGMGVWGRQRVGRQRVWVCGADPAPRRHTQAPRVTAGAPWGHLSPLCFCLIRTTSRLTSVCAAFKRAGFRIVRVLL